MPIIVSEIKIAPGEPKEKAFEKADKKMYEKKMQMKAIRCDKQRGICMPVRMQF